MNFSIILPSCGLDEKLKMRFFWQIEPKICDKIAFKHEQGLRTPLVARGVQARVIEKLGSEVGKI